MGAGEFELRDGSVFQQPGLLQGRAYGLIDRAGQTRAPARRACVIGRARLPYANDTTARIGDQRRSVALSAINAEIVCLAAHALFLFAQQVFVMRRVKRPARQFLRKSVRGCFAQGVLCPGGRLRQEQMAQFVRDDDLAELRGLVWRA